MKTLADNQSKETRFQERYTNYSDQQLMDILRNHKDYQAIAVAAAVKIAIERKLIYSEQDLLAPEFQISREKGFSIFPHFRNDHYRKNMISSASRILYLNSILPLVYGILSFAKGEFNLTISGIALALIWFSCCFFYFKTNSKILFAAMLAILLVVFAFVVYQVRQMEVHRFSDLFILIIAMILPLYLLFFYRNLKNQC